jgi:hypothetical protein
MCEDCTKENYIWATGDDLVTEHHKANIREMNKKVNKQINKIIYELSGILGGKEE